MNSATARRSDASPTRTMRSRHDSLSVRNEALGTAPTAKPWKGLGPGVLEVVEYARRKRVSGGVHGAVRESRVRPARVPEEVSFCGGGSENGAFRQPGSPNRSYRLGPSGLAPQ